MKKVLMPRLRNGLLLRSGRHRDENIADEVITRGCYERPLFDFEILPGDVWIDVGAHIGVFTSLALSAGAKVVAVEPDIGNFEVLLENAALNTDQCRGPSDPRATNHHTYILVQAAVLEHDQQIGATTTLHLHPDIGFRHSVIAKPRRTQWATCTVPATSLSALLEAHPNATAVKVDIQGAEVGVIRSVQDWCGVRKLVFEYDFEYSPDMAAFHGFISDLRQHFPFIYHARLAESGRFVGFPNGVVVFAKRDAPQDTSEVPYTYIVPERDGKGQVGLVRAGRRRPLSAAARKKIKATLRVQTQDTAEVPTANLEESQEAVASLPTKTMTARQLARGTEPPNYIETAGASGGGYKRKRK